MLAEVALHEAVLRARGIEGLLGVEHHDVSVTPRVAVPAVVVRQIEVRPELAVSVVLLVAVGRVERLLLDGICERLVETGVEIGICRGKVGIR